MRRRAQSTSKDFWLGRNKIFELGGTRSLTLTDRSEHKIPGVRQKGSTCTTFPRPNEHRNNTPRTCTHRPERDTDPDAYSSSPFVLEMAIVLWRLRELYGRELAEMQHRKEPTWTVYSKIP
jgi:hypothetical protein